MAPGSFRDGPWAHLGEVYPWGQSFVESSGTCFSQTTLDKIFCTNSLLLEICSFFHRVPIYFVRDCLRNFFIMQPLKDVLFFSFLLSSMGRGAPRGPPGPPGASAMAHGHTSVRCTHGGIVFLSRVVAFLFFFIFFSFFLIFYSVAWVAKLLGVHLGLQELARRPMGTPR